MSAILSKIFGIFGSTSSKEPSIKEKIDLAIIKLDMLLDKVAELRYRFEARNRELMEKVKSMILKGQRTRAQIYAGEVVQVRNILKIVNATETLIEMTKERLQTVKDSRELAHVLLTFGAALEEVKGQAGSLYPGLAYAFDEISRNVKTLIVETSIDGVANIDPVVVTNEAYAVLTEAMKKAEESIKSKFPEPPVEPVIQVISNGKQPTKKNQHTPSTSRVMSIEELEDKLLEYIQSHGGFLDIKDFTTKYGVDRDEVFRALNKLAEKGLIALT
ncbi:MAG: hypothetical protein ABWW69_02765 [Pyrodictiaceae archaeon]